MWEEIEQVLAEHSNVEWLEQNILSCRTCDVRLGYWPAYDPRDDPFRRHAMGWYWTHIHQAKKVEEMLAERKPEGATLEQLQAAPVGARAVAGDDRVIGKTEEGWKVIGFISKVSLRDADVVDDKTALGLSPLTLITERQ